MAVIFMLTPFADEFAETFLRFAATSAFADEIFSLPTPRPRQPEKRKVVNMQVSNRNTPNNLKTQMRLFFS